MSAISRMTDILAKPRRWQLRQHGAQLMARYVAAVAAICDGEMDFAFAEACCPILKRYRRRAKACARMLRREQA